MRRILLTLALLGLASGAWAQQLGAPGLSYTSGVTGDTVAFLAPTNMDVATTGLVEEIQYTLSIPANSFPTKYKGLIIRGTWKHAANAQAATGRIRVGGIGGTLVISRAVATSGAFMHAEVYVMVLSATSLVHRGTTWDATNVVGSTPAEFSPTLTGAIDVVWTALTGTAAGDLNLRQVSATWIK